VYGKQDQSCRAPRRFRAAFALVFLLLPFGSAVAAADEAQGRPPPARLLWGDTHLHTAYSVDAFAFGNVAETPELAYRFASGEAVTLGGGALAKLKRPLDFLVVTDHAEFLGLFAAVREGDPDARKAAGRWSELAEPGSHPRVAQFNEVISAFIVGDRIMDAEAIAGSKWQETVRAAEVANRPGEFTAFAGFEWSSSSRGNLHRNVMFRDGIDRLSKIVPFSGLDSQDPERLWAYLVAYEKKTGGNALAIPHNSNMSRGEMFATTRLNGEPADAEYARQRGHWEPVVEVTQNKGDSETHPLLSINDEFADYGTWDQGRTDVDQLRHEYARSALRIGLQLRAGTGVNPFEFGMIGSTDSHTSLATAEEDNYWGQSPQHYPSPDRVARPFIEEVAAAKGQNVMNWEQMAAGYTAVWATENTRAAIFDALRRREVYASTGPRIGLRFFGGWEFELEDAERRDPVEVGYREGVPMGSVLRVSPAGPAAPAGPRFLVVAQKDPLGANLDRIQIVKGWIASDGETHEAIHDVVWSGERQPGEEGKLPPVGNTVDLESASFTNAIGAAALRSVWIDPDFDPAWPAFYYVRVLEIPTPRWTLYDRARFGGKPPPEATLVHQERVYSSPIWYYPKERRRDAEASASGEPG